MGLKNTYQARKRFTKVPVSKTGMWYQDGDVVVPSNQITMKGPNGESDYFNSPIMGTGMQSGQTQIMQPGREYSFPNDNSVYERKMQNGAEVALDVTSMIPGPVGMTASGLGLAYDLYQGDWLGAGLNTANILTGGAAKGFMAAARVANNAGTRNLARGLASSSHNLNRASKIGNSFTQPVDRARTILNSNPYQQTQFGGYQDNTRLAPMIKPRMQGGGEFDPEFMFKNKYNTELTPSETVDFSKWAAKESQKQGRDILNDMGAYDVKGFWKSGDYKNMDSDNHGTDTWKKPNHPTFSNQSKYHGADGWYGGNWTDKVGYQPSKQTLEAYGPDYYNWMFKSEPGRSEYLDMSRYESGINKPTPFVYQKGGRTPIYVSDPDDPRLKAYNDSTDAYDFGVRSIEEYNAAIKKGKEKGTPLKKIPKHNQRLTPWIGTNIMPIESNFASPTGTKYGWENSDFTLWTGYTKFKKPVQPVQYKPAQKQVSYPNQPIGTGMKRSISKNINSIQKSTPTTIYVNNPTVKYRDPEIVVKQQQLLDAGYNIGEADGIWGPKSQEAWNQMNVSKQTNQTNSQAYQTPTIVVKDINEDKANTLRNQYQESTGTPFKSKDQIFNSLQQSLKRKPTVKEYNDAVEQFNRANRSMQYGGWLKSYQDAGEVSTEQNPEPIGQVHVRAKDKGWFDNYIERPLRKFGRSYAKRISDATGGSEWYKQPNPFMNLAFESMNAPQYAATYAVTGKVQTPSEAMNIQNPYGAFAVDAVLDPTNLLGAGLLKQPIKNIYKRNPASISNLGEADSTITDLLDIFGIPDRVANIKSIGSELKGEIIKGGKNRKAIEEGNTWLKNWIADPITQNKIENDLAWASQRNDQYGLGYQQAKSFTPISKEYPFSQQLKDLFSGDTHMHSGNTGVSYLHRKDPYERLMPETLNNPKMGSFISRIPSRSSAQRRSTTIHEGTHDWTSNYLLRESGQTDFIKDLYSDNLKKSMSSGTYDYSPEAFHLEYLAKPTEMHARIMQLRNLLGMTPEQSTMVTPEMAKDIIRKIEIPENAKFVDPKFLNVIDKDPKKLAALFNRLWAAPAATALGASQLEKKKNGGLQRSYLKTKKFK